MSLDAHQYITSLKELKTIRGATVSHQGPGLLQIVIPVEKVNEAGNGFDDDVTSYLIALESALSQYSKMFLSVEEGNKIVITATDQAVRCEDFVLMDLIAPVTGQVKCLSIGDSAGGEYVLTFDSVYNPATGWPAAISKLDLDECSLRVGTSCPAITKLCIFAIFICIIAVVVVKYFDYVAETSHTTSDWFSTIDFESMLKQKKEPIYFKQ